MKNDWLDIWTILWQGYEQMDDCGLHKPVTIWLRRGKTHKPFPADVLALDLTKDLDALSARITDHEANRRAMSLAASLKDEPGSPFGAVYIIGPEDDELAVSKVGIADDPRTRLCTLQIGNWNKLAVKGLLWFDSGPGGVERLVHEAAAEMGIGVRGEWLAATWQDAAALVMKAARYSKQTCYDSDIWLKNWASRIDALAVSKGIKGRLAA